MFRSSTKHPTATKAVVKRGSNKPIEIMMVDDSPTDVRIVEIEFRNAGLRNHVFSAEDGIEAMRILRDHGEHPEIPKPDLILLDLHMPLKNGHEVLKEIREDPALKAIPVVMLTVSDEDEMLLRSYELHADCFLSKPFEYRKLLQAIDLIDELSIVDVG